MISIALCTYNGAEYIEELLDSINNQTVLPTELVVQDDKSSDQTIEIIERFKERAKFPVLIDVNNNNLGVIKNFELAMNRCTSQYIAFSDQDDVWKPNKLEVTLQEMQRQEQLYGENTPILVHTDLEIVDSQLQSIAPSMMQYQHIQNESSMDDAVRVLLAQNYVTGCTMLCNQSLLKIAVPLPNGIIMHDWWLALIAALYGHIGFIKDSTILYRQHCVNQVGAKSYVSTSSVARLLRLDGVINSIRKTIVQSNILVNRMNQIYAIESVKPIHGSVALVENYLKYIKQRDIRAISQLGIRKQGWIRNLFLYIFLWCFHKTFKLSIEE